MNEEMKDPYPIVIAHRGASGEAPENTIAAIQTAIEKYEVDMVEIDVRLTRDDVPVLLHDAILDRLTEARGPLRERTLKAVQALDVGFRFDPKQSGEFPFRGRGISIPTLAEVLETFSATGFMIEIKERDRSAVETIMHIVANLRRMTPVILGSLHETTCHILREQLPPHAEGTLSRNEIMKAYTQFRLGLRRWTAPVPFASIPTKWRWVKLDRADWISFLKAHGVRTFFWTVNDADEMKSLLEKGADGILTDYPDRLNQIVGRKPA